MKKSVNTNIKPAILITGGAGYIGSHTVYALLDAGFHCIVIDDLSRGNRNLLPKSVKFIQGDIANIDLIKKIIENYNIKAIIHFAAYISVDESLIEPMKYFENNTSNTIKLVEIASQKKIPFIFSSTAAVYGEFCGEKVKENDPLVPINPYGASKLAAEICIQSLSQIGALSSVILRYFNVAGADPLGRTGQPQAGGAHLITRACLTALGFYDSLNVYGDDYPTPDGTCIRDYIHVSDLANAHVLALQYLLNGGKNRIFNCGYGHGFSVKEIVSSLEKICGKKISTNVVTRRKGDPMKLVADTEEIKNILSWSPRHDNIHEIIETALNWEKKRGLVGK